MKTLVSVPPALVGKTQYGTGKSIKQSFATSDPKGAKLGSGGGTAHLIVEAWKQDSNAPDKSFESWMQEEKRVVLHSGGQSRRLPAYGPSGKALLPVPVFRWIYGQRIDQTLLDLQLPLLQDMLDASPESSKWIIASGDVLVWQEGALPPIPEADVICVGLSESVEKVTGHGVFFTPRNDASHLAYMLQKPTVQEVGARSGDNLYFIDVGIWILSHRAMTVLMKRCGWDADTQQFAERIPSTYDLYTDFGLALGSEPQQLDDEVADLTCAVLPMPKAEFYHFGKNSDIIASALALQERVNDPKRIHSPLIKPNPAIFIQNSTVEAPLTEEMRDIWIENSMISRGWSLAKRHVLTGIPNNSWNISLEDGICVDMIPIETGWVLRVYGFSDAFRGEARDPNTHWIETPLTTWCERRNLTLKDLGIAPETDLQYANLFPIVQHLDEAEPLLKWMLSAAGVEADTNKDLFFQYQKCQRVSADWLNSHSALEKLFHQRNQLLKRSFPKLLEHADRNIFHQIDLHHAAKISAETQSDLSLKTPDSKQRLFAHIRDQMFRHCVKKLQGETDNPHETMAFEAMREAIVSRFKSDGNSQIPTNSALSDQVIWARSPVRLDLAGGWSDTPPYCMLNGGSVVNVAVELNGQPPIQVFIRVCEQHKIVVRSIDLGISETLDSYSDIETYALGSGFSIAKAALALAGFHPDFHSLETYPELKDQLRAFGGGIEISLLCAIPKGSGLGTSSILSSTLLGALSDLCGLNWEQLDIADRTLAIEQMLTSGGGWQDQYGGILHGIKHLSTETGLRQIPDVRWLPDYLFTNPPHKSCLLLYYTGITRVAKSVLGEIVRGMFLNQQETLLHLSQIHDHARTMRNIVERGDFNAFGKAIRSSWKLNQALDKGTNPSEVQAILTPIQDLLLGMKLLGAGGGGYFLMVAKSPEAAARIKNRLESTPPNARARFVDFSVSGTGLQITRS